MAPSSLFASFATFLVHAPLGSTPVFCGEIHEAERLSGPGAHGAGRSGLSRCSDGNCDRLSVATGSRFYRLRWNFLLRDLSALEAKSNRLFA